MFTVEFVVAWQQDVSMTVQIIGVILVPMLRISYGIWVNMGWVTRPLGFVVSLRPLPAKVHTDSISASVRFVCSWSLLIPSCVSPVSTMKRSLLSLRAFCFMRTYNKRQTLRLLRDSFPTATTYHKGVKVAQIAIVRRFQNVTLNSRLSTLLYFLPALKQ